MGIVMFVAGIVAIIAAVFGDNFEVSDADAMTSFDRPSSRWSGRAVFLVAGICFLAMGMKLLFAS